MKKIGILLFLVTLALGVVVGNLFSWGSASGKLFNFSLSLGGVRGSGQIASESRDVGEFNAINVGGVFQVEFTAEKEFAIQVEADDNLLPLIRTEVQNGVLVITTEGKLKTRNPIKVLVSAPELVGLDVSGAAKVIVQDLNSGILNVDASGASKVKIDGRTSNLTMRVSGATRVDGEKFMIENANIEASGASQVSLQLSGELRADASGASRITYSGTPTNVIKHTSGAASVSQH
jgi:hypothetical protein